MAKVIERADLTEAVMTATRGPDTGNEWEGIEKYYGAAVIRNHIEGWGYGTISPLPFTVITWSRNHYSIHIAKACQELDIPVITVDQATFEKLPLRATLTYHHKWWTLWAHDWIRAFMPEEQIAQNRRVD